MTKPKTVHVDLDSKLEAKLKSLGGSNRDSWNSHLSNMVASALPVNHNDTDAAREAAGGVFNGMADINPADPIEGILVAQLIAANEAALSMYRRGWAQPSEYFEARTKYLSLADKAARTVVVLSERLDQHRNRGQQQITVKHVTVNAENAMVADSITTAKPASDLQPANLLAAGSDKPMPIIHETKSEPLPAGVGEEKE